MRIPSLCLLLAVGSLGACGGRNSDSKVDAPGDDKSAKTSMLEAGADLLQGKAPLRRLDAYLDGFHFYNGAPHVQMEAHHYCGHVNDDVIQCVIFDGNDTDAKLMGVEYILSREQFVKLPSSEKHLWHSHAHEVRSGQLIAPGIPEVAEHELMEKLAGTYGKTWHTWHTDQAHALPLGVPQLMMGFTRDGQADEKMVRERDQRFGVSSEDNRADRSDIRYPVVDTEADAWQKGVVLQPQLAGQKPMQ